MQRICKRSVSILMSLLLCLNNFVMPAMAEEENASEATEEPVMEVIEEATKEGISEAIETSDETQEENFVLEEETEEMSSGIDKKGEEDSTETEDCVDSVMEMSEEGSGRDVAKDNELDESVSFDEENESPTDPSHFWCSITNGEATIGYNGNHGDYGETEIIIPDEMNGYPVKHIGGYAFQNNNTITKVIIPEGVESVGDSAFYNCTKLEYVNFPSSLNSIGDLAFADCELLKSDISTCGGLVNIGYASFKNCELISGGITILESVTSIGPMTFYGCENFSYINLPDTITKIELSAFDRCSKLKEINLPEGLQIIEEEVFNGCSSLQSLYIPSSLTTIGKEAFWGCGNLNSIIVNSSNPVFDSRNECNAVIETATNILLRGSNNTVIPNTVTSIGAGAFSECISDGSLIIPSSVTEICSSAFAYANFSGIIIPNSVKSIGHYAFLGSAFNSVTIPNSVTSLGEGVFEYSKCKSVNIPGSIEELPYRTFMGAWDLERVDIAEGVKKIGDSAFDLCESLEMITIPNTVVEIGRAAFYGCDKLKDIRLPDGLTTLSEELLLACGISDITIPPNVTSIGKKALQGTGIKSVVIPDKVKTIGEKAFLYCPLESVTIPASVTTIGDGAFSQCYDLENVYYAGSEEQWNQITVGTDNDCLLNATIHYGSEGETQNNIPIIVIPGIMGSELYKNEAGEHKKVWVEIPGVTGSAMAGKLNAVSSEYNEQYCYRNSDGTISSALIAEESDSALRETKSEYGTIDSAKEMIDFLCETYPDRQVYLFAYDWRQGNSKTAMQLESILIKNEIKKADIVAHSMGGLVLSQYVKSYGFDRIEHTVTCGTPYEGAHKVFNSVFTYKTFGEDILDRGKSLFLAACGISVDIKKSFDGVVELTPTEDLFNNNQQSILAQKTNAYKVDTNKMYRIGTTDFNLMYAKQIDGVEGYVFENNTNGLYGFYDNSQMFKASKWLDSLKFAYIENESLYKLDYIQLYKNGNYYELHPVYTRYLKRYNELLKTVYGTKRYENIINAQNSVRNGYKLLQKNPNSYLAIGKDRSTMTGITSIVQSDGRLSVTDTKYTNKGDGTVPFYSANMLSNTERKSANKYTYYNLDHMMLFGHDLDNDSDKSEWNKEKAWIKNILDGNYDSGSTTSSLLSTDNTEEEISEMNYRTLRFEGPVIVSVEYNGEVLTNDLTNYNDETSFGIMDILGAEGEITMFCLDDGIDYNLTVSGTEEGHFNFRNRYYVDQVVQDDQELNFVPVQETSTVDIDSKSEKNSVSVDYDGDGVIDLSMGEDISYVKFDISCTEGGIVSPSELNPNILIGEDAEIIVKADEGYTIDKVLIDGVEEEISESDRLKEYTTVIENVTEAHSIAVTFADHTGIEVSYKRDQDYAAAAVKPDITVTDAMKELTLGKDYTLSYKNNKKAYTGVDEDGVPSNAKTAPSVTITMKGLYKGSKTVYFNINPADISESVISPVSVNYNVKGQKPLPKVVWNNKTLKNGTDYTVSYLDSENKELDKVTDAGEYTIVITGKGNYEGSTAETKLIVAPADKSLVPVSKLKVTFDKKTCVYNNGEPVVPTVTVKDGKTTLQEGTDYLLTIPEYTKTGTGTVTIEGIGSYTGTRKDSFQITGKSISKLKVSGLSSIVFDGTEKELAGYEVAGLTEGTDYTVSYANNINAGTATILFTGINAYTGTLKKTFKITALDINAAQSAENITYDAGITSVYTKSGAKPIPVIRFTAADGTVKVLRESIDYKVTYKNNKTVTDNAEMIVKGTGNFKGTMTIPFTITKAELSDCVSINAGDKKDTGKANNYKQTVKVLDENGKALKINKDYTLRYLYEDGTEIPAKTIVPIGTTVIAVVTASETSSLYTGTASTEYRIVPASEVKDISKGTFKIKSQEYTGKAITIGEKDFTVMKVNKVIVPLVTSESGDGFMITGYSNNIRQGTAYVTLKGVGSYSGTKVVSFVIGKRTIGTFWTGIINRINALFS